MRSMGLGRWYITTTITILDRIQYLKHCVLLKEKTLDNVQLMVSPLLTVKDATWLPLAPSPEFSPTSESSGLCFLYNMHQ
jgi:hypothetical protein